jgi:hypothetical protein
MRAVTCEVCGRAAAGDACEICGHPEVPAEAARLLWEASRLAAGEDGPPPADRSRLVISRVQQAVRLAPDAWLPRLRLAAAFERKAGEDEPALARLAEREYGEALKLAPERREVHVARLAFAARRDGLPALRAEYEARRGSLACAEECLRMIQALEEALALAPRAGRRGAGAREPRRGVSRWLLPGAVAAGLLGGLEVWMVARKSVEVEEETFAMTESPDFYAAVVLWTAAGALGLEWWRARQGSRA